MSDALAKEFISQSIERIDQNTPKIIKCLDELDETDIWKRPNKSSNSIGNLILHLCGNITQYIISSLGSMPDQRERDKEFSTYSGYSKTELKKKLLAVIEQAKVIIQNMNAEELLRKRRVQGFDSSGIGNIIQVTEHYSYHTGQIIFWTKLLKDKDLAFYAVMDLNKKNEI